MNRPEAQAYQQMTAVLSLVIAAIAAWPYGAWASLEVADKVVVEKSDRKLYLVKGERILAAYDIFLGMEPEGHKEQEGDSRTPEGLYYLDARNEDSDFFLSIRISYPNGSDRQRARRRGVDPGGQIMIHGYPNEPKYTPEFYRSADWTDGCIAVSNAAMVDIWLMTRENTPIEIRP
ncbi:MAG: L,D-transpeptidase family protein [Gammaproteobacteria bacterium]